VDTEAKMLLEFRIANFRCFRGEQVFSLVASSDSSHPNNVVDLPIRKRLRLLKTAVIYGANASGKTAMLDALYFYTHFIRTSASKEPDEMITITPFLLNSDSASSPSSFEATFVPRDGVLYQYGFTVDQSRVNEEWLMSYPKGRPRKLFRRYLDSEGKEDFEFGSHLKGEKEKLRELTRPNALFLSVGATFNHPQLLSVYRWLSYHVRGLQANRMDEGDFLPLAMKNKGQFSRVRELLKYADLGIVDFSFRERVPTFEDIPEDAPEELRNTLQSVIDDLEETKARLISIEVFHQGSERKVAFDLEDESNGTRQLFALSFFILSTLAEGGVIYVDELDTSLHPLLVRALVRLFHDPQTNPRNAQLIFNTHDTTLLSSAIFRRDQIWLVEKDVDGASCAYSLLEYSPRKDEALERGYLQGRYGAIPFLSEPVEGVISNA
jgi:AAA15 family ATPase/GTPase